MSSQRVVIAYDGSPAAIHAIEVAGSLLAPRPATIVSVWGPVLVGAPVAGGIPAYLDELEPELEGGAQRTAEDGVRHARDAGFDADAAAVRASQTWRGIVEKADELDAGVIVVGARGLSGIKSALLGSTSHGVLHHTRRPVFVVADANAGD